MKKVLIVLIFLFISLSLFATGWVLGYQVGLDGYVSSSYNLDEIFQVGLNLNLVPSKLYSPIIKVGTLIPKNINKEAPLVNFGLSSGVFVWHNHLLKNAFRRQSAQMPRIEASLILSFTEPVLHSASLLFKPFNYTFGDKEVAVGSAYLVYNFEANDFGWGIRVFEINHWLF
ncbi:MAG: hypothetical protein ACOXZZ_06015 [Sphaerochaetaceae bacterium]|jgi:hypothetical protein